MENLLISACLMGFCCKYSGGANTLPEAQLAALRQKFRLIPVCPETAGGLPVPRDPSERQGDRVATCHGRDVTAEFEKGAEAALCLAKRFGCKKALLKENSPSCGSGSIYDGSFSGVRIPGYGLAAERLKANGLALYGESRIEALYRAEGAL